MSDPNTSSTESDYTCTCNVSAVSRWADPRLAAAADRDLAVRTFLAQLGAGDVVVEALEAPGTGAAS